ncbi:hypothetical protein BSKO_00142 [Bryopsis sp. KO-2023]|nr:hypothetical protein BSKO_00142 [Bryopsis sp. KO-2023]
MSVEAEAFKVLYPEQYFARFFEKQSRPDSRSLTRARATTIGFDAVSSADSSALVKIGSTTALATAVISPCNPTLYKADVGGISVQVEITPLCAEDTIPGRYGDWGKTLARQIERILHKTSFLSDEQLTIPDSVARWGVSLSVTILDADGCIFDAAFLSCVSVLRSVRLPKVEVDTVKKAKRTGRADSDGRQFKPASRPVSSTFGALNGCLVADPTAEEEAVMTGSVTTVVEENGNLLGMFQSGTVGLKNMRNSIEIAKMRQKEVDALLNQAIKTI